MVEALIKWGLIAALVAAVSASVWHTWEKYVADPYREDGKATATKQLQPKIDAAVRDAAQAKLRADVADGNRKALDDELKKASANIIALGEQAELLQATAKKEIAVAMAKANANKALADKWKAIAESPRLTVEDCKQAGDILRELATKRGGG